MKKIEPTILKKWMDEHKSFILIDVRESWERELFHIGGKHMPLGEIVTNRKNIRKDVETVVYCEKGIRSAIAIQRLEALGYTNLINLDGGMSAWKKALFFD